MPLKPLKQLFEALSAAFALIPGLAALLFGLGAPPGRTSLFGGVVEGLGALTLLLMFVNQRSLKDVPVPRLTRCGIWLGGVGFGCVLVYIVLYRLCIVTCPGWETIQFPLWTAGELAEMINSSGGRSQAICLLGYKTVFDATQLTPLSLALTLILLLIVFAAISTCLTAAFGLLGAAYTDQNPHRYATD